RGSSPFEIVEHLERHAELYSPAPFELRDIGHNPVETVKALAARPDWLGSIESKEFEEVVASWFSAKGYRVEPNWNGRDAGYDFTIYPFKGERALVEVKKYKQTSQVPVSTIRQMVGSMSIEGARYGLIVSSSPFTQAAIYFASEIGQSLLLLTLDDLDKMESLDCREIESAVKG
ncbi:restriction endonuclease, partial [Klebsiella pneumoniae]